MTQKARSVSDKMASEESHQVSSDLSLPGCGLLGGIKERLSSEARVPCPPTLKNPETGFPVSRKRRNVHTKNNGPSRETSSKGENVSTSNVKQHRRGVETRSDDARSSISQENDERLANMSRDEIEQAKEELMRGLSPSLIEKLLRKASIEDGESSSAPFPRSPASNTLCSIAPTIPAEEPIVSQAQESTPAVTASVQPPNLLPQSDREPTCPPADLFSVTSRSALPSLPEMHFPKRPAPPDLDPDDPNFLEKLHSTYFPLLPSDPSTLAWMTPVRKEELRDYSPSQDSLPSSSLRFDFRGHLLPPRLSAQMPVTKGLHHHGHAPESAGYTIPELSRLARSAVTSQRCIAYQTIGRISYRLGRGDFGADGEVLCDGMWDLIEQGKVLEFMIAAASKEQEGNKSIWATATDAVWLWRKGGGRKWKGR